MDSVILVSSTDKAAEVFEQIIRQVLPGSMIITAKDSGQAKDKLRQQDFSLCFINAPLTDEFGDELARFVVKSSLCQVILIAKKEICDKIELRAEGEGIFVTSKPIVKGTLQAVMRLSKVSYNRLIRINEENKKLTRMLDDVRIVDRAKCVLIEVLGMTEQDAHRYIEKQAMDMRQNKRNIAERIIKTYEN